MTRREVTFDCLEDRRLLSLLGSDNRLVLPGLTALLGGLGNRGSSPDIAPPVESQGNPDDGLGLALTAGSPNDQGNGLSIALGVGLLSISLDVGSSNDQGSLLGVALGVGSTDDQDSLLGVALDVGSTGDQGSLLSATLDVGSTNEGGSLLGVALDVGSTSGQGSLLGVELNVGSTNEGGSLLDVALDVGTSTDQGGGLGISIDVGLLGNPGINLDVSLGGGSQGNPGGGPQDGNPDDPVVGSPDVPGGDTGGPGPVGGSPGNSSGDPGGSPNDPGVPVGDPGVPVGTGPVGGSQDGTSGGPQGNPSQGPVVPGRDQSAGGPSALPTTDNDDAGGVALGPGVGSNGSTSTQAGPGNSAQGDGAGDGPTADPLTPVADEASASGPSPTSIEAVAIGVAADESPSFLSTSTQGNPESAPLAAASRAQGTEANGGASLGLGGSEGEGPARLDLEAATDYLLGQDRGSPREVDQLAESTWLDPSMLDRAIAHYLEQLESLGGALADLLSSRDLLPWLYGATLAASAFVVARQLKRKAESESLPLVVVAGGESPWLFGLCLEDWEA